ncbi:MAG: hypothetical protein WB778_06615 [Thermoplasmata archaeon]
MLSKKRRLPIVGLSVGVAVATFLVLVLVPVPQHFSMRGAAIYDLQMTCSGIYATQGTTVSFHWSAPSSIYFFVVSCPANQGVYEGNGTIGSGSFVSTGSVYEFGASCPGSTPCVPADVSGSYTSPLLVL